MREVWRLAKDEDAEYFPLTECDGIYTEYCCIFGISRGTLLLTKTVQYVLGNGHSYLIASAPDNHIY